MVRLPWDLQLQEADTVFVTKLYETKLKKYYDTLVSPTNQSDMVLTLSNSKFLIFYIT